MGPLRQGALALQPSVEEAEISRSPCQRQQWEDEEEEAITRSTQERTWLLPIAQKDCTEGSDRLGLSSKTGALFSCILREDLWIRGTCRYKNL